MSIGLPSLIKSSLLNVPNSLSCIGFTTKFKKCSELSIISCLPPNAPGLWIPNNSGELILHADLLYSYKFDVSSEEVCKVGQYTDTATKEIRIVLAKPHFEVSGFSLESQEVTTTPNNIRRICENLPWPGRVCGAFQHHEEQGAF